VEKITGATLIPISLAIAMAYVIFNSGGLSSQVDANTGQIISFKADSKDILKTLKNIESRMIKLETSIDMLAK